MIEAGRAGAGGEPPALSQVLSADVMMIAAGGDERRLGAAPLHQLEAEHAAVEGQGPIQIGDLKVHMADARAIGDWPLGPMVGQRLETIMHASLQTRLPLRARLRSLRGAGRRPDALQETGQVDASCGAHARGARSSRGSFAARDDHGCSRSAPAPSSCRAHAAPRGCGACPRTSPMPALDAVRPKEAIVACGARLGHVLGVARYRRCPSNRCRTPSLPATRSACAREPLVKISLRPGSCSIAAASSGCAAQHGQIDVVHVVEERLADRCLCTCIRPESVVPNWR